MPGITVRYYSGPAPRPKPRQGDRRTTKKHGVQVRVHQRSQGCMVMGGGHRYYLFDWKALADLVGTSDEHLLTKDERASLRPVKV